MPWRLVQFIVIFAIFLLFIMFNLDNRSDISLGFTEFKDIPVFLTAFFAFIAGMMLTFPFIVTLWLKARKGAYPAKKTTKKAGKKTEKGEDKKGEAGKQAGDSSPGSSARKEEPTPADIKDYGID